jgi:hypothetical protein
VSGECSDAMDRLVELLEPEDPTDPEVAILARLRAHASTCPHCQRELAELRAFFTLDHEAAAVALPSDEELAALDAGLAAQREEFLAATRSRSNVQDLQTEPVVEMRPADLLFRALESLEAVNPVRRLELLKEVIGQVLERAVPHEVPLLDLLWRTAVANRAAVGLTGTRAALPALGAIGAGGTGSLATPPLIELALWLDTASLEPAPDLPADVAASWDEDDLRVLVLAEVVARSGSTQ